MIDIELILGTGSDTERRLVKLPGVPRIGEVLFDNAGHLQVGVVYAVYWMSDSDSVQVRAR